MDSDGSGELSREELIDGFDNTEEFRANLQDLDIQREDLEIVWIILDDDKSGLVSYTEFIAKCLDMKSSDQQFMLAYIRYYVTEIRNKISDQMAVFQTHIDRGISLEEVIKDLADKEHG